MLGWIGGWISPTCDERSASSRSDEAMIDYLLASIPCRISELRLLDHALILLATGCSHPSAGPSNRCC